MIPDHSPAARRHVADQLGVSPDAPPADARAAFLRALPAAGFLPAPPLCAAAAALTARAVPGATGAISYQDDDAGLRAEFDTFTREFWSVPPAARRDRWQTWLDRSANDSLLAARVRRLEAGVDLPDAAHGAGSPRLRDVAGMIQALFVLGAIERAARRRELLDSLPPPTRAWETAALEIARDFPAHAALEPALVERLSNWANRPKAAARAVGRPAPTWGFQTKGGLQMPQVRPNIRPPAPRRAPAWTTIGLVFLVISMVRGLSSSSNSPSNTPTYRRSIVTQPSTPQHPSLTPVVDQEFLRNLDRHNAEDPKWDDALRRIREHQSQQSSPSDPRRP